MANNLTDYLENSLLGHLTGKAAWTAPTNTYLALFTVEPTDEGGGTEVEGTKYARRKLTWGSASEGAIATSAETRFPAEGNAESEWGTVVAVAIFDAVEEGEMLVYGPLSSPVTIKNGDFYRITSGGLTLTLS
jgi:hypothetical protein